MNVSMNGKTFQPSTHISFTFDAWIKSDDDFNKTVGFLTDSESKWMFEWMEKKREFLEAAKPNKRCRKKTR